MAKDQLTMNDKRDEEENKVLRDREGSDKGQNREDDDLVLISLIFLYFNFVFIHLEHSH